MNKPRAKKQKKVQKFHGLELEDNYAWLRDKNWQQPTQPRRRYA